MDRNATGTVRSRGLVGPPSKVGARTLRRSAIAAALLGASAAWPVVGAVTAKAGTTFVPGTGASVAQGFQVAPTTGGLAYNISFAQSLAGYQVSQGQAQAQSVDLGVIGTSLYSQGCDGSAPTIDPSQVPQAAMAESTDGDASDTQTFQGNGGAVVGRATAMATTQPAGTATSTISGFTVAGAIDIGGSTTKATSQLIAGKTREATAEADVSKVSLAGGVVVLQGLHWEGVHRTGDGATTTGSFTIGGITVSGVRLPVGADTLAQAFGIANAALAQSGLHLTPPASVRGTDGSIRETPLQIGINGTTLGQQVFGPLLGAAQPLREAIGTAILAASCKTATPLLLADIASGPLAGGGDLNLNLGGVNAVTDGSTFANPFGPGGLGGGADLSANPGSTALVPSGDPLSVPQTPALVPDSTTIGAAPPVSAADPVTGTPTSSPPVPATAVPGATGTALAANPISSAACSTTHPSGHPGCSHGLALPVGLVGLTLMVGLGAADLIRARRRTATSTGAIA